MKKQKMLSIFLVSLMVVSLLTGCSSASDKYFKLTEEMNKVSKASFDASISVTLDKSMLEGEEMEDVTSELEIPEEFKDKDGNIKIDLSATGKVDIENKKMDMNLKFDDEKVNLVLVDKDAYIEIDGVFDILEKFVGEEIGFVKMFLGDYKYIKGSVEANEGDTKINVWEVTDKQYNYSNDFKEKIKKTKGMLTQKDGVYTLTLDNESLKEMLKDNKSFQESLKEFSKDKEPNMTMTTKLSYDKKANTYNNEIILVMEGYMTINAIIKLSPVESVEINVPNKDDVLDTNEGGLFPTDGDLSFGEDFDINNEEDVDFDINETDENEFIESNQSNSSDEKWEDSEYMQFNANVSEGVLSKFIKEAKYDSFKDYAKEKINEFKGVAEKYDFSSASESYDDKFLSSSVYLTKEVDNAEIELSQYLGEDYTNISYSFDVGINNFTDNHVQDFLKEVKELLGLEIDSNKLMEAITKVKEVKVPKDEFGYSVFSDYEENDYDIRVSKYPSFFDGDEDTISIEVEIYSK